MRKSVHWEELPALDCYNDVVVGLLRSALGKHGLAPGAFGPLPDYRLCNRCYRTVRRN
jgi:hypothetical protein